MIHCKTLAVTYVANEDQLCLMVFCSSFEISCVDQNLISALLKNQNFRQDNY